MGQSQCDLMLSGDLKIECLPMPINHNQSQPINKSVNQRPKNVDKKEPNSVEYSQYKYSYRI